MLRQERQHVIEERNAGANRRLSRAVDFQLEADAGFIRVAADQRVTLVH